MKIRNVVISGLLPVMIAACTSSEAPAEKARDALRQRVSADLVSVEGGRFEMGDVGKLDPNNEQLNYSFKDDDKPVHTVSLSPYRIQKHRVTQEDYDDYLAASGKPDTRQRQEGQVRYNDQPVGLNWHEAQDYCVWAGQLIGMKGDLPTEAQWEYAARSGGKVVPFATDNGTLDIERNVPSKAQIAGMYPSSIRAASLLPVRVGRFPPNPLGLYDMGFGGLEWTKDWYVADYYQHAASHDPQGPDTGEEKVLRGLKSNEDGVTGEPVQVISNRYPAPPDLFDKMLDTPMPSNAFNARCVFY